MDSKRITSYGGHERATFNNDQEPDPNESQPVSRQM